MFEHWVGLYPSLGLYLSFHLSWALGPFVHGRLQNRKTSKDIGHGLTPLTALCKRIRLDFTSSVLCCPCTVNAFYSAKTNVLKLAQVRNTKLALASSNGLTLLIFSKVSINESS